MYDIAQEQISNALRIVIIQPENPDADSLGSAIALEEILTKLEKKVSLFCAIDMPKYLHYIEGWSRVSKDWDGHFDLAIIVDTASEILMNKSLETPGFRSFLETHPVLIIDHHIDGDEKEESLLSNAHLVVDEKASATGELIFDMASSLGWQMNKAAAESLLAAILGDTLGLSTQSVSQKTVQTVLELMNLGSHPSEVEQKRRDYMKKPADILAYKGQLIDRIEYYCNERLALVHIPWEDIAKYSDRYNPSVLVLDEMRLVEKVDIAIAIKTYPDGKLTGKIRSNIPVAEKIASFFGGGGHEYSAGYKIYEEDYQKAVVELLSAVEKILNEFDNENEAN